MDEEKLIILVSGYKELYDFSNKNYANQDRKNNCWKEIAEHMRQPASDCKERWSRLRDNFRKALKFREGKSGDAATKIRPYKFEKEMSFLKRYMTDRCQKSNFTSTANSPKSGEEAESSEHNAESDNFVDSELQTPASTSGTLEPTTPVSLPMPKKKRKVQSQVVPQYSVATVLEKYLESQSSINNVNTEGNSLRQFFIAMADTAQSFPPALQIAVKSKVFNIIQEAELKCLQQKDNIHTQTVQDRFENTYWTESSQAHHVQPSTYTNQYTSTSFTDMQEIHYNSE